MVQVVLDESDRKGLADVIHDSVLDEDRVVSDHFLDALIGSSPRMVDEIVNFGFGDTATSGEILDVVSRFLIGRRWPKYSEEIDIDEFYAAILSAYDNWVTVNS